ncbi:CHAT domain-containing protein, partial [Chloroflexota bacterium]
IALDRVKKSGDLAGEGQILSNLTLIAFALREYDKAQDYAEKSFAIARRRDDHEQLCISLNNLASIQIHLGRPTDAEILLRQALNLARVERFQRCEVLALDNLGTSYIMLGRVKDAINSYRAALSVERNSSDKLYEAYTRANLGMAYLMGGWREEAVQELEIAVNMLEKLRANLNVPDLQANFIGDQQEIYNTLITLLVDEGDYTRAFSYSERARARSFLDQLARRPIDFHVRLDTQLSEKERMLQAEIATLRAQLSILRYYPSSERDSEDTEAMRDQLQTELKALENDYEDLLLELQIQSPEIVSLISVDVTPLTDIQSLLDADTTLVEYFVTEDRTSAFIITQDKFETVILDVNREELANTINMFRDFASLENPQPIELRQLHKWLITPLKPHLTTPKLGVVPHDVLHYLPFAALTDGERYLSDDYVLFTLPSASVLRFIQEKRKPKVDTLLALGNPTTVELLPDLNFAEQEVETIADLYGIQPLVDEEATESIVQSQAGEVGILHLAAHSVYNKFNPLFSVIHLAGDSRNDGRLEVYEVYELDLTKATDLVVLSACQTQIGELSAGDEVVGLNRAFLYAGTPSVISSLWNVNDEATALLMEHFYTYLRAEMGKAEALQQAQIEVRRVYPHPYYWAAFVLTGDAW